MKYIIFILSVLTGLGLNAQKLRVIPLQNQRAQIVDTLQLSLPFWDDFSTVKDHPDSTLWVIGKDVFVNSTIGINPPTWNVATFDGLMANGQAHDLDAELNGAADSLVTQPINLSGNTDEDEIYLSFYWQARGLGELPDPGDSLVLYFLGFDPDLSDSVKTFWVRQWSQDGGEQNALDAFTQEILPVDSGIFFHQNFQMKFVSYSNLNGPFDTWNLDYIYLNANRSATDLTHLDRAIGGRMTRLFAPYREIPSNAFFRDPEKFLVNQGVEVRNLDSSSHPIEIEHYVNNLVNGEQYLLSFSSDAAFDEDSVSLDYYFYQDDELPTIPNNLDEDSVVIEATFFYQTGDRLLFEQIGEGDTATIVESDIDLAINDTVSQFYTIHNHYAYDDGSAEFAVALNIIDGQVAFEFPLEVEDTLSHIDIYFPSIAPGSAGRAVDVTVWSSLDPEIILRRVPYMILESTGINDFQRIRLASPIVVEGTIYIGFQQSTNDYIGIGFDRNSPEGSEHIFFETGDGWEQNVKLSGSLLMRPVFAPDTEVVTQAKMPTDFQIIAYPNPTSGVVSFSETIDHLTVINLSGQVVYESGPKLAHDLSMLPEGIYLLKLMYQGQINTQKLIIQEE